MERKWAESNWKSTCMQLIQESRLFVAGTNVKTLGVRGLVP